MKRKMIRDLLLIMVMLMISTITEAYNCLPLNKKNLIENSHYNIITVKAPTYDEAEIQLIQMLPSSGFHQHLQMKEERKLIAENYYENRQIKTNLKANIDHWLKFPCQYKGDYYITAVIAKADIKYLDQEIPKWVTLKNIKEFCKGYNKITIVGNGNGFLQAEKIKKVRHNKTANWSWQIGCGDAVFESRSLTYKNVMDEFKFIGYAKHTYASVDRTIELWLELTKDIQ